ncbi:VOC family protein [Nesterenkonia marinintestina]|uniref:VOC family protein n=1 Tax=Nesterenkonia marinintestina TaxID=2979865 RepID=UPI0021BF9BBE|nr:VOC family protein [Nesterenkonia sp. GX14115]
MTMSLPFLMFQGRAQEAVELYLRAFPDAELLELEHHPEGAVAEGGEPVSPAREGDGLVANAQLRIGGQALMIQDSLIRHDFDFTPAISFAVVVETSPEFEDIVEAFTAAGCSFLMEPDDYGFSRRFAWIRDPFGVSWQINLPLSSSAEESAQARPPVWG